MAAIVNGDEMEESFNQILKMLSGSGSGSGDDGNEFIAYKIRALQASLEKGKEKMQQIDPYAPLYGKLPKEEGKRRPFTGDSVTNTAKFLEDNKGKKKMVYLFARSFNDGEYPSEDERRLDARLPKWHTADANANGGSDVVFKRAFDMVSAPGYPHDHRGLLNMKSFGSAVWRDDMYLVGGYTDKTYRLSDQVWIFTPAARTWKQGPSMKLARSYSPMLVAMENRLCVFGGCNPGVEGEDVWFGEIYDGAKWDKFPSSIPKSLIKSHRPIQSHAVHGEELFLWDTDVGIFSYSFVTATWKFLKIDTSYMLAYPRVIDTSLPLSFAKGPTWSAKVAVVGDFLFWNFYQTIYACDLLTHDTRPVHTLRDYRFSPYFMGIVPDDPTFLVHVGDGKLCLFYTKGAEDYGKCYVCYDTFLIKIEESQGTKTLDLVHHSHGECDIQAIQIHSVMEVQA